MTCGQMTRDEHLAWAKARALEYADQGDATNAMASIGSDLQKHPDTANHAGIQLGMMMMMSGNLRGREEVRRFIEGFN